MLVADKAHCIRIASDGGHRYSVPAEYVGKKVVVRVCRTAVEIYDSETMKRLGSHQRYTSTKGPKTHLLDEHLTDAEKHYRRTSREWIELFVKKGMNEHLAADFVAYLTDKKGNFPSGRTCGPYSVYSVLLLRVSSATLLLSLWKTITSITSTSVSFASRLILPISPTGN